VSTLDDLTEGPGGMAGLVGALSRRFRPVTRRNLLVGATVAAAALATKPKEYLLRPVSAYPTICGPGNLASAGWTVFCCTINNGVNACPPGSFAAGWWKAADSSWCGSGYRYIVDCNASCSRCTTGCGTSGICSSSCWSCSCGSGSTATCDQRRVCCNAFRYGQCNTQVKCSGGVHCRVVSCVAPYQWANCTTTTLVDNRTSEHSAPCLPAWGAIEQRYMSIGDQASFLKASTGPNRSVGDSHGGVYGTYQGGEIYWTSTTGAQPVGWVARRAWGAAGGLSGPLGYPTNASGAGTRAGGWIQLFQGGALAGASATVALPVFQGAWTVWQANGREGGPLGYPIGSKTANTGGLGWHQQFQGGFITGSTRTPTLAVYEPIADVWVQNGRELGPLGYPTDIRRTTGAAWLQLFEHGAIAGTSSTPTLPVAGVMYAGWVANGGPSGLLKYPLAAVARGSRGGNQQFQGGELWELNTGPVRVVYGSVLTAWKAAGGAAGRYGYPVTDTTATNTGQLTCQFEGGTITA
jgi:LGFP repeat